MESQVFRDLIERIDNFQNSLTSEKKNEFIEIRKNIACFIAVAFEEIFDNYNQNINDIKKFSKENKKT